MNHPGRISAGMFYISLKIGLAFYFILAATTGTVLLLHFEATHLIKFNIAILVTLPLFALVYNLANFQDDINFYKEREIELRLEVNKVQRESIHLVLTPNFCNRILGAVIKALSIIVICLGVWITIFLTQETLTAIVGLLLLTVGFSISASLSHCIRVTRDCRSKEIELTERLEDEKEQSPIEE